MIPPARETSASASAETQWRKQRSIMHFCNLFDNACRKSAKSGALGGLCVLALHASQSVKARTNDLLVARSAMARADAVLDWNERISGYPTGRTVAKFNSHSQAPRSRQNKKISSKILNNLARRLAKTH
jgi:PhoPQ-activated pathogenicity-related protein